ncbi:trans-sialidase, putative, partial [Trypanosoma cruzi marinkellei]
CGAAAAGESNVEKRVDALLGIKWEKLDNWENVSNAGGKYNSLRGPSLVEVQGHVFAIAEAQCKEDDEGCSRTGIASRRLVLTDDKPLEILTNDTGLAVQFPEGAATGTVKAKGSMRPTTVAAGNSVYMLLRNQSFAPSGSKSSNALDWGLLLVKGSVSGDNKITWKETHAVTFGNEQHVAKFFTQLVSGGGSGVKTKDGTLMFPMQATKKNGNTSLLSMRFDNSEKKWKLSQETVGDGCREPTIVEWGEEDRLLIMASCAQGYRNVYASTASGLAWYTYGETLTRVWGNSHDRKGYGVQNGFIKVTIKNKEVMLVTLPMYSKDNGEGNKKKGRLHLWLTDNARVYDVGPISREDDDAAASSLLMQSGNEKLISVYENRQSDGSYNLVAVSLRVQLERIKSVVETWAALDSALQSCRSGSTATVDLPKKGMCNYTVPTEGLVGFLSGRFSENTWRDEYLCVNATVTNGERRVPNGWTFKGSGAGAVWPVGDMGQTVPYYFANNDFSLVATVSIHEVPQNGSVPLIGVRMNDTKSTVLFGLSYTHEKKWRFTLPNKASNVYRYKNVNWQPNKTHQLVLKMEANEWGVYVDGKQVYSESCKWTMFKEHRISHFYFGADNKEGAESSHATLSNVLLYNRTIREYEIAILSASKVPIPNHGEELLTEEAKKTPPTPAAQAPSPEVENAGQGEEEGTTQEVEEAQSRPQSPAEASEGSDAVAVSSGGRGSHETGNEETEMDDSGGLASPLAPSSVSTAARSGDDGMSVHESTSPPEEVPPVLGTEEIPNADVERPIHEEEATSPEEATERQAQETAAPLVENGDSEGVGSAPVSASTQPGHGDTKIPLKPNSPSIPSDADILLEHGHFGEVAAMALVGDSTVHGCVSRVLLLLLGLWGTAALC